MRTLGKAKIRLQMLVRILRIFCILKNFAVSIITGVFMLMVSNILQEYLKVCQQFRINNSSNCPWQHIHFVKDDEIGQNRDKSADAGARFANSKIASIMLEAARL